MFIEWVILLSACIGSSIWWWRKKQQHTFILKINNVEVYHVQFQNTEEFEVWCSQVAELCRSPVFNFHMKDQQSLQIVNCSDGTVVFEYVFQKL